MSAKLHDIIDHFGKAKEHVVCIHTGSGHSYEIQLGSDDDGNYEMITDVKDKNGEYRRIKSVERILEHLGIDEDEIVTIGIDAYWTLQ